MKSAGLCAGRWCLSWGQLPGLSAEQVPGNRDGFCCVAVWVAPALFFVPTCLSMSQLCRLGGVKPKQVLSRSVLKGRGSSPLKLLLSFSSRGTLSSWGRSPFTLGNAGFGAGAMRAKPRYLPLFSRVVVLQLFVTEVPYGTPEPSRSCCCLRAIVYGLSFVLGGWRLGSPLLVERLTLCHFLTFAEPRWPPL